MTITLAVLVTDFLDRPGLTNSTIRSYESILKKFLLTESKYLFDSH